jgi:hypothetical protein
MILAAIIPDGVGVRNFVLGRLLRSLPSGSEAHVFHGVPEDMLPRLMSGINGQAKWHRLERFHPFGFTDLLQGSLAYGQMYWARTMAMRRTLSLPIRGPLRRRCMQQAKRLLGRAVASPQRMKLLEKPVFRAVSRTPEAEFYRAMFQRIKPTVLFCSQQLSLDAVPAVVAAKQMGIPSAAFIFSWDNLTSKGRIVAPFDYYFVWSQYMKDELLRYYPNVSPDNVHVVGTPQFEPYADPTLLLPRTEFFRSLGADPSRPLICYSGGDAGTCPEDPQHVGVLMELIRSGRIKGSPQVVVRPVPVDNGTRYAAVKKQYPELIFSMPKWMPANKDQWSGFIPQPEDISLLANLTHHADLNVNLGSTMILDFGIHDKPVVNVAFDVANPPIFGMPVYDFYYHYEHLRPVIQCKATRIARSPGEFVEHVNAYLMNPALDRQNRRDLVDLQILQPIDRSTGRLTEALLAISRC